MKPVKLKVNEYNNDEIERISKRFNLSKTSAKILLNRNIKSFDDIDKILQKSDELLYEAKELGKNKVVGN